MYVVKYDHDIFIKDSKFNDIYLKNNIEYLISNSLYDYLCKINHISIVDNNNYNVYNRPIPSDFKDVKSILFWRYGGLGDTLFILPVINYLKELNPDGRYAIYGSENYKDIFINENIEYFSGIVEYDIFNQFEYIHDYTGILEDNTEWSHEHDAYHLHFLDLDIEVPSNINYLKNIKYNYNKYEHKKYTISIVPFASTPVRSIDINIIADLVKKLNDNYDVDINIFTNKTDSTVMKLYTALSELDCNIIDTYLLDAIEYLNISDYVVTVDSGLLHVAGLLNKNILTLTGSIPSKDRTTIFNNVKDLNLNMDCSPCYLHGGNFCKTCFDDSKDLYNTMVSSLKLKPPICMNFNPEDIYNAIIDNNQELLKYKK